MITTDAERLAKNAKIKKSREATRERRASMKCVTYQLKIDVSRSSKEEIRNLDTAFVEGKWTYNAAIASLESENTLTKLKAKDPITVRMGKDSDQYEDRQTRFLGSQVKQGLIAQASNNLSSLKALKNKGHKVGKLGYIKECRSLPFSQHEKNFTVDRQRGKILLQKLGWFVVHGMKQIPKDAEIACAKLIKKASGYFLMVTTYVPVKQKESPARGYRDLHDVSEQETHLLSDQEAQKFLGPLGIDMGVKDHITTSAGETVNILVPETKRLKGLQRKLAKQVKGSNSYIRTKNKIRREYERMGNVKDEKAR